MMCFNVILAFIACAHAQITSDSRPREKEETRREGPRLEDVTLDLRLPDFSPRSEPEFYPRHRSLDGLFGAETEETEEEKKRRREEWDQLTSREIRFDRFFENDKLEDIARRFKAHVKSRMDGRMEFFGVDFEDPESLDRMNPIDRQTLNDFMRDRFARAGEWYLANLLDPNADEMRDLLPPSLRDPDFFRFGALRFSRSIKAPRMVENVNTGVRREDGSTLDDRIENNVLDPFVDAGSGFDWSKLGEIRYNGRIRSRHVGGGIGWRPWEESFPVQFRVDYDHGFSDGRDRVEASALLDLYDLWDGRGKHKEHLFFYARWDFDQEEGWVGIAFSSG